MQIYWSKTIIANSLNLHFCFYTNKKLNLYVPEGSEVWVHDEVAPGVEDPEGHQVLDPGQVLRSRVHVQHPCI